MFASIEVLIGLAFVYLILALIVMALTEWVASAFRLRAKNLRNAVTQMLDPLGGHANTDLFYKHPRIHAISEGRRPPSYIPSKTFAEILKDLTTGDVAKVDKATVPILAPPEADESVLEQRFLDTMNRASGWYKRRAIAISVGWAAVVVIIANADTLSIAQTLWSSPVMRAAVVAQAERRVAMGPPRGIVDANYGNPTDPVPSESDESAEEQDEPDGLTQEDRAVLDSLLGWTNDYKGINDTHCELLQQERDDACRERGDQQACSVALQKISTDERCQVMEGVLMATSAYPGRAMNLGVMSPIVFGHLFGWLLSVAAISLGAPFWFDTLSRFVNLRGAGPPEKPKRKGEKPDPEDTKEK
jgi:hypothetical protein